MNDYELYLRALLSLGLVLVMIAALAFMIRKYGTAIRMRGGKGTRRLAVVEVAAVDQRRRLVLVRRDDTEHLLLTGGPNDLVIEGDIMVTAAVPAAQPATAAPEDGQRPATSFRRQLDQVQS
ncbi:MAG TPA: flagellar biosynthetic protein FliO [Stellaceae bacterium]|nr:flagellar biosynthetic protein FliO [Stellaceae bacterium]